MNDEQEVMGFSIFEKVGMSIQNPGVMASFPITDEMWANLCKRAEKAGMDPIAFFDEAVERSAASDEEGTRLD